MCMILKFQIPAEKGNQAIKDGSMGKSMEAIVTALKPEAAHFMPMDGRRSGMLFFQLTEESQIVQTVEPFFLNLNAEVELIPVMNGDDLRQDLAKVRA